MKQLLNIAWLLVILQVSACTSLTGLWRKEESKDAVLNVKEAHPVGVAYDVASSNGERKQISIFFNGKGIARLLDPALGNVKVLVDFDKQTVCTKDFDKDMVDMHKLDPFAMPCVLNARYALEQKALSDGTGSTKGFPYHRWLWRKNDDLWEVWTDDNDSFPVYFRSVKAGEVCTWTIVNAWVDGSTLDKPTFYTLEADPPPPEWVKAQEELKEKEKKEAELALEKEKARERRRKRHVSGAARKSSNKGTAQKAD